MHPLLQDSVEPQTETFPHKVELTVEQLFDLASAQRNAMLCCMGYLVCVVVRVLVPAEFQIFAAIPGLLSAVAMGVFVFLMASKVFNLAGAVAALIVGVVPFFGLIALGLVSSRTNEVLKAYGLKVGVMGADTTQFIEGEHHYNKAA